MSELRKAAQSISAWAVECDGNLVDVCLTETAAKLIAENMREKNRGRGFVWRVVPLVPLTHSPRDEWRPASEREMLELAAKALGMPEAPKQYRIADGLPIVITYMGKPWNPLTDDGDALRLAVKLGLHITQYPIYDEPKHSAIAKKSARLLDDTCVDMCVGIEVYGSDPYAATRRAIVRAAAEIGRQMEESND